MAWPNIPHRIMFITDFGYSAIDSDLYLVHDGRPVIAPPSVKTNLIEVPGASGTIDLSTSLTNYVTYGNREGDLKYHVLNEKPYSWSELYHILMNNLHGHKVKLSLEDDPSYYYEGTLAITDWTSNNDGTWSDVTIHYVLDPYKYHQTDTDQTRTLSDGSWAFTFDDSIGTMPIVPEFTVNNIVVTTTTTTVNTGGSSGSSGSGSSSSGNSGSSGSDDGVIVLDGNDNNDSNDNTSGGASSSGSSGSSETQTITEVTGGIYITASNPELGINVTKHITTNGTHKFYDLIFSKINSNNVNSLTITGSGRVNVHYRRGDL